MSQNVELKKTVVAEISDRFARAQGVVLVDYRGLTVEEVTQLRRLFRKENVEYKVLKNTLIGRAAKEQGIEGLDPVLEGPTAVAFGYDDPVAPARIVCDFIKKTNKVEIKCGIVSGKVVDAAAVNDLAKLPSKEVLVAKMLGSLNSPAAGLVGVLSGPARALAVALNAIREQKEQA